MHFFKVFALQSHISVREILKTLGLRYEDINVSCLQQISSYFCLLPHIHLWANTCVYNELKHLTTSLQEWVPLCQYWQTLLITHNWYNRMWDVDIHYGVPEPALTLHVRAVCALVVCTGVSAWTQGTVHAPGLSVQTAALCVCSLPVGTQRPCARHGFCHCLPADTLVVYLLRLMLLCKHTHTHTFRW